jgi:hypothetical protein
MVRHAHREQRRDAFNYIMSDLIKMVKLSNDELTELDVRAILTMLLEVYSPGDAMFYYVEVIAEETGAHFRPCVTPPHTHTHTHLFLCCS